MYIPLFELFAFQCFVGAGVYRAYDAIKSVASAADLQYPNLIRTSNMRKYMATMLQVSLYFD